MKTLQERREYEWAFYENLYSAHSYGKGTLRWVTTNQVCRAHGNRPEWARWLDVGSGAHKIEVPSHVKLVRTDPGHPGADHRYAMHQLVEAFGEESFDVVSSFDVLEHLLPEELEEGIMALWDVCAPGGCIIVSVGTDRGGPWNDRYLHLTQISMGDWQEMLEDLYEVSVAHVATSKGTSPFFVSRKPA